MTQVGRMYCSNCKTSIYQTFVGSDGQRAQEGDIGAVRVPVVMYFVIGQPEDTGGPIDFNGPGVRVPAFVREIMHEHVPIKRAELCVLCMTEIFGTPCVTAEEDTMYSAVQAETTAKTLQDMITPSVHSVDIGAAALSRVLLALRVGRGAEQAPPLPPEKVPVAVAPSPAT